MNLSKTYWGKKIAAARKRGRFTERDRREAIGWVTCACGRVTADIPRYLDASPDDKELFYLGGDFAREVRLNNFTAASRTLRAIEARAVIVARENSRGR